MKTNTRFLTISSTMILAGALAALGCSAAPGTTGGNGGNGGSSGSSGLGGSGGLGSSSGGSSGLGGPVNGDGGVVTNPPSGATPKEFCTGLGAWMTKCGSTPAAESETKCEGSYQKYTSAQIAASEKCLTQNTSCDSNALSQCLAAAVATGGPTGGDAGAPPPGTCQQCVTAQCSAQLNGCKANPDCVALYQCMQNAKTQQDVQACETQSPNGVTDLQTLLQCVTGPCGTVCK